MVERLLEAIQRGLWEEPPEDMLRKLQELYLELETELRSPAGEAKSKVSNWGPDSEWK